MMLHAPALEALPSIRHAFFTRKGGVSRGRYASLNCGFSSEDDPDAVRTNRARALAALELPPAALHTGRQVHGTTVISAATPWPDPPRVEADAVVTNRPGLAVAVLTADCAPVLLADADAGVVGAVHAGWRGALAGVIEAAVAAMVALGGRPERLSAAIGPCIRQASYEVGPEFQAAFLEEAPANARFFVEGNGDRLRFDLEGYVTARLRHAGVRAVQVLGEDTVADPARFFSNRRTQQNGGGRFGLLLSAIALIP
jgi:YfiH family protein